MRILLVRLGAFGDIVHTLPLAAELAAAGHHLGWLCEDRWACLLEGSPAVAGIHRLPRKVMRTAPLPYRLATLQRLVRELRHSRYDLVIDAQGLAKSGILAALAGAKRRLAHAPPRARELSWLGAKTVPATAEHVIDQQLGLLAGLGIAPPEAWRFPLPAWEAERTWARRWLDEHGLDRAWMINVGAGWPTKVWPEERLQACAAACRERPALLLWGSPSERAVAERIAAATSVAMAPDTTIPQLAGLLDRAAVLISGDTGPLHLARALGTPAVGLFGPVPMARNGPRGPAWRNLQAPGAAWERHDASKVDMSAITVDMVLAEATAVAR